MINYSIWCFWFSYHLSHSNVPTVSVKNRSGVHYFLHALNKWLVCWCVHEWLNVSNGEHWMWFIISSYLSHNPESLCSFFFSDLNLRSARLKLPGSSSTLSGHNIDTLYFPTVFLVSWCNFFIHLTVSWE